MVDPSDPRLSAVSSAAMYGKGVFTTAAIAGGKTRFWKRHERRLKRDSAAIGLDASSTDLAGVEARLTELAGENGVSDGKARVTLLDRSGSYLWEAPGGDGLSVLIQVAPVIIETAPLELTLSPFAVNSTSPLAGIKSCNYLEPVLAAREAAGRGFDEAIRLNESGIVTSCCLANLFWISGETGSLRTPPLAAGCIPGTTREFLMETEEVEEVAFGLDSFLEDASSVFATSAVKGIAEVGSLEGDRKLNPIPDRLRFSLQAPGRSDNTRL